MRSCLPITEAPLGPPDVDVGVIYTGERELMPRLLSTLAASSHGVRMRLVLVDNSAPDGVEPWQRAVSDVRVLHNTQRLSYAANLNRILAASTARYILALNTDVYFDPRQQCVARMVRYMDGRRDCGIAGCAVYHADGAYAHPARRFQGPAVILARRLGLGKLLSGALDRYLYRDMPAAGTWECQWLSGCFLMIRRQAFQDVGYFDEGFAKYFEDVDFCYRMACSGWRVMHHGATHCYHLEQRASRQLWSADALRHLGSYFRWHWKWGLSYRCDLPQPLAPGQYLGGAEDGVREPLAA
jgi:N-acetylglucosaminyl-diphospho-decaprenol L-rhamnosyltransferase